MTTPPVPSDTDRLAEIRARLDACERGPHGAIGQTMEMFAWAGHDIEFLLAENASLQGRLDTAEADLAALEPIAAPHRMTADQRERYRRHASWEGAEHFMKQAEAAARRWQREADWLREFRDERKAETEAGTWPLPGDFDCCERHPARALGLGEGDTDA